MAIGVRTLSKTLKGGDKRGKERERTRQKNEAEARYYSTERGGQTAYRRNDVNRATPASTAKIKGVLVSNQHAIFVGGRRKETRLR